MLVRNHMRDVWNIKYHVAYCVVQVLERQSELIDESSKTQKVNLQDVKIMYPLYEVIKCVPDAKAFGHAARYHVHTKLMSDLGWSLNPNVLPPLETTIHDLLVQQLIMIESLIIYLIQLSKCEVQVLEKINNK